MIPLCTEVKDRLVGRCSNHDVAAVGSFILLDFSERAARNTICVMFGHAYVLP